MPLKGLHSARLRNPGLFQRGSFYVQRLESWRGITIPAGISFLLGRLISDNEIHVAAIRFNADLWSPQSATKWLQRHRVAHTFHVGAPGHRGQRRAVTQTEEHGTLTGIEEHRDADGEERRVVYPIEELRIAKTAQGIWVSGLAVPFLSLSVDLGGFRERVLPNAFDEAIARQRTDDLRVDVQHDTDHRLLARSSKGTAQFTSERDGVRVRFRLPDTTLGRDTLTNIRNGNLDAMSPSWRRAGLKDQYFEESGEMIREIRKATLTGVALTHAPAYRQTVDRLKVESGAGGESDWWVDNQRRLLDIAEAECKLLPRVPTYRQSLDRDRRRWLQLAMAELKR